MSLLFRDERPERDAGVLMQFATPKRRIFAVTWLTYAGYYLCRKNLSVIIPVLHVSYGLGSLQLAHIVFAYSLFYVAGQFVCGYLSDRFGAKRIVAIGLLLVVFSNLMMGAHATVAWLLPLACINGLGQSTGWSGLVKMMAMWFDRAERGVVMAWWGTNYVFGGFLATAFAAWVIALPTVLRFAPGFIVPQAAWRRGFILPAIVLLVIAMLFIFLTDESPGPETKASMPAQTEVRARRSGRNDLAALLRNRELWLVGTAYFFLEMCRYALLFWLPLYLVESMKYSVQASGYVSSLYDLVGIVGAVAAGYISDKLMGSRRAPITVMMLFGLGVVLLCQPGMKQFGIGGVGLAVALAGLFSYGPDTMLSGAWAQDIGEARSAATACGLIEGIGHVGSLFSPYLVVAISGRYGWDRLFLLFGAAAFLGGGVLLPLWSRQTKTEAPRELAARPVSAT